MAALTALPFLNSFITSFAQAQSIPTVLPANWSSVGCFTDVSTSRSLRANMFTADNLTIESCLAFCDAGGWVLGGVEFGKECYCDGAIQVPSVETLVTDCNMGCGGQPSELCGGPQRLNIFQNTQISPPLLVQSVNNDAWTYQGCFTDSPASRTLPSGINVPAGVTAETCTATCQTAGFNFSGLENGNECWCGDALTVGAQHVSDNDCRQVCTSTHAEFCGNANRIAVYSFGNNIPKQPAVCAQTSIANFTLRGVVTGASASGKGSPVGSIIPLKVLLVEMVPSLTWAILSACPLCCTDWPNYALQDSVFKPKSLSLPIQAMVSSSPGDGESPVFVASNPAFPGFQSYCTVASQLAGKPALLAFGGKADAFSLCPNLTAQANGRVDVVFSPVTGHPHYDLDDCSPINVEIVT